MKTFLRMSRLFGAAALAGIVFACPARAGGGFISFLFGPGSAGTARQAAHAAADAARRWLDTPNHDAELRRAGNTEALGLKPHPGAKELEAAFAQASSQARDTDPATFLLSLESAAQSAALHSTPRIVVSALNTPPFSTEADQRLADLVEYCRAHSVRVVILDIGGRGTSEINSSLESAATGTGGMWLRQGRELESAINMIAAGEKPQTEVLPQPPSPPLAAEPAETPAPGAIPFEIPVHTRFIRTSMTNSMSTGTVAHLSDSDSKGSAITINERPFESNESTGPLPGMLTVEAPLNALLFQTDDNASTYHARARIVSIVKNQKGRTVWTAQKEVDIHGPLRGMAARQQGSLLFLRGITLPGGDTYTLEARVDDLLGGTSGLVRTPLTTGSGARGLMASDALFVRRFKGAADKFVADQVLSYEGEALSPVLNPVFRAGTDVSLQLYFILYPDIHGEPPQLSLELSRDGRIVSRIPIAFMSRINDPSREGKFGTLGGKGSVMVGGRAHEFPYLANIKGARFAPGCYDALLSIRQGRNVITRHVAFQVTGGTAPAAGSNSSGPAGSDGEDMEAAVELPAIEPVTLEPGGLSLGLEEQNRLWTEAAEKALGYTAHLPNFRCLQETHRFTAPAKTIDQLKEADSFKDELTYEDGRETYRTLEVNGLPAAGTRMDLKGVHSLGEFGSMLRGLFDPEAGASYQWAGRTLAMGVLCEVFQVEVPRAKSNFTLTFRGRREAAGYTGRVYIDEDTGLVRRLTIEGKGLPKNFGLQSPSLSLDYAMVRVGAEDYLLPLRSVLQLRQLRTFVRNETVFRDYHRFDASSEIKLQTQ